MKRSIIDKLKRIIPNEKGETLMEVIVSIMLFSVFMAIVSQLTGLANNILANSFGNARESQETVNEAILEEYKNASPPDKKVLVLEEIPPTLPPGGILPVTPADPVQVEIEVFVSADGSQYNAFAPPTHAPTPVPTVGPTPGV